MTAETRVISAKPVENGKGSAATERLRLTIQGAVQGVGFRPFIYRLASELGLCGWVENSLQGVIVEAEGPWNRLDVFLHRIHQEKPPLAVFHSFEFSYLDPKPHAGFQIRQSVYEGEKNAVILPDIATCRDCLREIFDEMDRRHRYPFTNCTNCGPRFSILEKIPYDRGNTAMKKFEMCKKCLSEYRDPANRRFHAEPNACPQCGPQLEFRDSQGRVLESRENALQAAAEAVRQGKIIALKGLGGFHLICDARSDTAVTDLRKRKQRGAKPFAVMFPSLEAAESCCEMSAQEKRLLHTPASPIVLMTRRKDCGLAEAIAPGNPLLGALLPYTPLHHLLLKDLGFSVVATSGNLSEEPIVTEEKEAVLRLAGIADFFLVHNRPIVRPMDDSIARIFSGRETVLRRAKGYAPLPIYSEEPLPDLLACGAHLKSTIAVSKGHDVFISQHIGDLENYETVKVFEKTAVDLEKLYEIRPQTVVSDLHPDYRSTQYAEAKKLPVQKVQHHVAHVFSCMAENDVRPPALGIAWDGTGLGWDHTIWGGEFFLVRKDGISRTASFKTFKLPGGDAAIREPRRAALALLFERYGDAAFDMKDLECLRMFSEPELEQFKKMLDGDIRSPRTSSVGRLFDAVSSLLGLCHFSQFEGQAAMQLEFSVATDTPGYYPFKIEPGKEPSDAAENVPEWRIDWEPMAEELVSDLRKKMPRGMMAAKFHHTLTEAAATVAERLGQEKVVLSGGCFQNRYLIERMIHTLKQKGFRVYWHQRVPPNDGGIALGQIMAVSQMKRGVPDVSCHTGKNS